MRYDSRIPLPGFPRRELLRLMSMLMMLALIGTTIYRFRIVAEKDSQANAGNSSTESAPSEPKTEPIQETTASGPNDQQPFEWSQAEYQFQAVTDKTPVTREEMPSYWRLMRWSMTQSFDDLWERAQKERHFTHLGQNPGKHRGELIGMNVSLRMTRRHDDVAKNSAGVTDVYEAWGITSESRTGLYCLVFYDLPPQLKVSSEVHEEADFVGYFHKLISYEDAMGKTRWAPMLIGRLRWRENPARLALARQRTDRASWPWLLGGAGLAALAIVVWTNRYLAAGQFVGLEPAPVDHTAIERWLESGGESGTQSEGQTAEFPEFDDDSRPDRLPVESDEAAMEVAEKSPAASQVGMPSQSS